MRDPERAGREAGVLEANEAFYRAFNRGDFATMRELWARAAPVSCLHPGAPPLAGREPVLSSFRALLVAAPAWKMVCRDATVHLFGDAALVTCFEANGEGPAHLAATNVFVLEEERWRMVHHHAGPLSAPAPLRRPSFVN